MSKYVSVDANSHAVDRSREQQVSVSNIWDNFAVVLKIRLSEDAQQVLLELEIFTQLTPDQFARQFLADFDIADINYHLFTCQTEERIRYGSGVYEVPRYGPLLFAGFFGLYGILLHLEQFVHERGILFEHVEEGDFLIDYFRNRCNRYGRNPKFCAFYSDAVKHIKKLPRFIVPKYVYKLFMLVISGIEARFLQMIKVPAAMITNGFARRLLLAIP